MSSKVVTTVFTAASARTLPLIFVCLLILHAIVGSGVVIFQLYIGGCRRWQLRVVCDGGMLCGRVFVVQVVWRGDWFSSL